jgi:hypothetical protein
LSEWIGSTHYRSHPCRSSAGIFDSTRGPSPASRTSSFTPINESTYRPRHGDTAPLLQSRELTRGERLRLTGMPDGHKWPPKGERCLDRRCCAKTRPPLYELVGTMSGNICSPQQAEMVMRALGLTVNNDGSLPSTGNSGAYRLGKLADKDIKDIAQRWHSRLGHPGMGKMREALGEQPSTVEKPTSEQIKSLDFCRTCAQSKQLKGPHGRTQNVRKRARFQNELLHVDTCFRRYPDSLGRSMIFLAIDDYSRWATVELYASRKKGPFQEMLQRIEGRVHAHSRKCHEALTVPGMQHGRPPLCFRTDGEGSILSHENINRMLAKRQPIDIDQVTAGAHGHNGVVERAHRTIIQITRSLMTAVAWPMELWSWAFLHAVYLYNRLPHPANEGGASPYFILHQKPPDWSRVRTFGCTCYAYMSHPHRVEKSKLNPSGERRVYIGQPPSGAGWMVYNPKTKRVSRVYSCTFEETLVGIRGHPIGSPPEIVKQIEGNAKRHFGSAPAAGADATDPDKTDTDEEPEDQTQPDDDGSTTDLSGSPAGSEEDIENEPDIWNTVFTTKSGDTIRTIAAQLNIPVKEIQDKNYDLPGSCPRTGRTGPDAELIPGTGLWVRDPEHRGVVNTVVRAPGPLKLADFISADSGLMIADDTGEHQRRPHQDRDSAEVKAEEDAYQRCYGAVMEQEQREVEQALLKDSAHVNKTAGDAEYDERQEELFGGFVHSGPPANSPLLKHKEKRGSSRRYARWKVRSDRKSAYLQRERSPGMDFDRWSQNRRRAYKEDSRKITLTPRRGPWKRNSSAPTRDGNGLKRPHSSLSKRPNSDSFAAHLSHTAERQKKADVAPDSTTYESHDPVDTVLDIMSAASDVVKWVDENWELSNQELNSHCERVSKEAEKLFEKAFLLSQIAHTDGSAMVLEGTEDHMARDIAAPKSYEQALKGRFAHLWQDSIQAELENLRKHEVYSWVRRTPGMRVIGRPATAFKVKVDENGKVSQFKTRICARGYLQRKGQDYYSSFAPVGVITTFRALIASASKRGMWVDSIDIRSAFLLAPLKAPLHCEPPRGADPPFPNAVWSLRRCLYGLKQSAHQWFAMLSKTLLKLGFVQGVADPCYFSRLAEGGFELRLVVHVDDILIVSNCRDYLAAFRERLSKEFSLTSSSTDRSCQYLGMTVARLKDSALQLSITGYTADLLHRFKMQDAKPVSTPMQPGVNLTKDQCPKTDAERLEMSSTPYLQAIGSLLWLVQTCRPDIAIAVNVLSRFASNPGKQHWAGVKWLLRYLAGTANLGIIYGRKVDGVPHAPLTASCDASWADCKETRSSTSGYVIMSCGGPISWSSQKMKVQALSSMEAEFHSLCLCARELVHLRTLFIRDFKFSPKDLTIPAYGNLALGAYTGDRPPPEPIAIMEDNTAAIALAKSNGARHSRAKHIELKWFWVRTMVQAGIVLPVYCPTKENISDLMTKPVSRPVLEYLRPRLLWPHEEPQSQDSDQPNKRSGASS